MRYFVVSLIVMGLLFSAVIPAGAASRNYIEEIKYVAGKYDNEFSSGVIAKEQVKRMLLNEMAEDALKKSSVPGLSESKANYIAEFSACVFIEPLTENWENGTYHYKAKIRADINAIINDVRALKEAGGDMDDILANRAMADHALKCVERIQEKAASRMDDPEIKEEYDRAVIQLHAADWYEKARFSGFAGKLQEAIDAYSKVIECNPDLALAYYNRGYLCLTHLKDKEKALSDYSMANQLFYNDAIGHLKSKRYEECVESLNYAIVVNPQDAEAFYQRAACYIGLGHQDKVLENFKTAAKLGHARTREMLNARGIEWE